MNQRLYVGNLSYEATENEVKDIFKAHGEVVEVKIATDRQTGRPRGFAFVTMNNADDAKKAKEALQGYNFKGRPMAIDWARAAR